MYPALIPLLGNVLDKIFPDQQKAAEAKLELMKLAQSGELAALDADKSVALAQAEINKAEAASGNWYASGWRPTMGYICCAAIGYNYLVRPALIGMGYPAFPALDGSLMELVMGMLGLAGFRTYEKVKGVA